MRNRRIWLLPAVSLLLLSLPTSADVCERSGGSVRFASFNAYLNRPAAGELTVDLLAGDDQAKAVAEIIQRTRPDVLLINEFDFDQVRRDNPEAIDPVAVFLASYLSVGQSGLAPIDYPYGFYADVNTGVASGMDLDNDGRSDGAADALGYGEFPGQYGMLLLSRFPIESDNVRTYQHLAWSDMPGNLIPRPFYSEAEAAALPLSSKSHWDVPVRINNKIVHVLAAHPTPPIFDGPEDRNGRRNFDEIRLWADYLSGGNDAGYIVSDGGEAGGLEEGARFVIMGDYNADPHDGDSRDGAMAQLLSHPRVNAQLPPASDGGRLEAEFEGQRNSEHSGNPAYDTVDINPVSAGNLRIDYVLPSRHGLQIRCGGVFWPARGEEGRELVGDGEPVVSSDHRLVWQDLTIH